MTIPQPLCELGITNLSIQFLHQMWLRELHAHAEFAPPKRILLYSRINQSTACPCFPIQKANSAKQCDIHTDLSPCSQCHEKDFAIRPLRKLGMVWNKILRQLFGSIKTQLNGVKQQAIQNSTYRYFRSTMRVIWINWLFTNPHIALC